MEKIILSVKSRIIFTFDKVTFAQQIKDYLQGTISEDELYEWNCGFLDHIIDDDFLNIVWARIHQLNEINPGSKTTNEELSYLYQCLTGIEVFSNDNLEAARTEGLNKRFGKNI